MSLGASEYSVFMAQNPGQYIRNLLRKEAKTGQERAQVIADFCRKPVNNPSKTPKVGVSEAAISRLQAHFGKLETDSKLTKSRFH